MVAPTAATASVDRTGNKRDAKQGERDEGEEDKGEWDDGEGDEGEGEKRGWGGAERPDGRRAAAPTRPRMRVVRGRRTRVGNGGKSGIGAGEKKEDGREGAGKERGREGEAGRVAGDGGGVATAVAAARSRRRAAATLCAEGGGWGRRGGGGRAVCRPGFWRVLATRGRALFKAGLQKSVCKNDPAVKSDPVSN